MNQAYLQPSTETLQRMYGITLETELAVVDKRRVVSGVLNNHLLNFMSIDGTCTLTNELAAIKEEAEQKAAMAEGRPGYVALDRSYCFFKPRSDLESWDGVDSTDREAAYLVLATMAALYANNAAEIGSLEQLLRYGPMLSLAWFGGRAILRLDLDTLTKIALADRSLPLAAKNDVDGTIEAALKRVNHIEEVRDGDGAPAVLIYRGGENAITPEASRDMCKRVIEATEGKVIIDTAHGVEMAHDPNGNFQKSVEGQIAATEMLVDLADEGYVPFGKLSEASRIKSPIDPHIALAISLNASRQMYERKMSGLLVPIRQSERQRQ